MIKKLAIGLFSILLFVQCAEEKNPFLISKNSIGNVSLGMKVKQLDSIFVNDSIVRLNPSQNESSTIGEVEIYEKGGKKLLLISPKDFYSPDAYVANFQIFDERFKTDKGLNINSTFKEIKEMYTISSIETTLTSVVVFLEGTDVFVNIDKKELPENLRYNPNFKIDIVNIPPEAKIKHLFLSWNIDDLETSAKEE